MKSYICLALACVLSFVCAPLLAAPDLIAASSAQPEPQRLILETRIVPSMDANSLVGFADPKFEGCHYIGALKPEPLQDSAMSKIWRIADPSAVVWTVRLQKRRCGRDVAPVSLTVVFPLSPTGAIYEPGMEVFAVPSN